MNFKLRDYQEKVVSKMVWDMGNTGNSVISLPTGCLAGDTPILMADGTHKEVKNVIAGDLVLSFDNFSQEIKPNEVGEVIRTSHKPKPMIELIYEKRTKNTTKSNSKKNKSDEAKGNLQEDSTKEKSNNESEWNISSETITVTYDHPFFDGERFYPLYQLIWGEMEASQRVQLELLCKQYGADFNYKKERGLLSCCNETCPRCERILQNSDEWKNNKSTQDSGGELVAKPIKTPSNQSYKWNQKRQPSGKPRVVYGEVQRLDWSQNGEDKNTQKPKQETNTTGNSVYPKLLSGKNNWTKAYGKEKTLQLPTEEIPAGHQTHTSKNSNWTIAIKSAEPYYSICMRKAPHTYIIGRKHHFITHNSGKSIIIAGFVERSDEPVLMLVPSKELLIQNREKLLGVVNESDIGMYSASVNEKNVRRYTIGTIQSVRKDPSLFRHFKIVLIDECHGLDPDKQMGMYNKFLKQIGNPKVFGLTATPYRQSTFFRRAGGWGGYSGSKWQQMNLETVTTTKLITRYKKRFWSRMLCVINTQELIDSDYLCPLKYTDLSVISHEQIPTNKTKSDFDLEAFEELLSGKEQYIVGEINKIAEKHDSVLVFCTSIEQAENLSSFVSGSEVVKGTMSHKKRDKTIKAFRDGSLKVLFNVQVLTTGFDYPELEAICLIRPTRSVNLYNQILGRLTRKAAGKKYGQVYDFSGTVKAIGKLESIKVAKLGGQWDVGSGVYRNGLHNKELYSYKLQSRKKDEHTN